MFQAGAPLGGIQPYFLTQADVHLDDTKPLEQQPDVDRIIAQALEVAHVLAGFIGKAHRTLDIAIYDFRLLAGPLTDAIVKPLHDAATRGVAVRLAFDKHNPLSPNPLVKAFHGAGADPAPTGTHVFVTKLGLPPAQVRAIEEEAVDPGHQIMHHKYMVRDHGTENAAVLMGSSNFTTDAWGIQDNNILVIRADQALATQYTTDFNELWDTAAIGGTGAGAGGVSHDGRVGVTSRFAPADGAAIDGALAALILTAATRIRIASMVISSVNVLRALAQKIEAGVHVRGVYDGPEMRQVEAEWRRGAPGSPSSEHLTLWDAVKPHLVAKASIAFTQSGPHNFMHNKALVVDDTLSTGSFNFSQNATRNAENVLQIRAAALAHQYATYIEGLVTRYSGHGVPAPTP